MRSAGKGSLRPCGVICNGEKYEVICKIKIGSLLTIETDVADINSGLLFIFLWRDNGDLPFAPFLSAREGTVFSYYSYVIPIEWTREGELRYLLASLTILMVLGYGKLLDTDRWSQAKRARMSFLLWVIPQAACFVWIAVEYTKLDRQPLDYQGYGPECFCVSLRYADLSCLLVAEIPRAGPRLTCRI